MGSMEEIDPLKNPNRSNDDEELCRVCGYAAGPFFEGTWPSSAICSCCGWDPQTQPAGLDATRELRGYWIGHGAQWHSPKEQPGNWDLYAQIQDIPELWR
ncbi:hypothetical protein DWB77_07257 [Streptomyces hundungensis]|uniref:Uncharacterized protein n=2 Tax=Streptomyces hundungensis TaxID=1077946 RepID=A0A387HPX1_9ACTN|nr:hypothetical protein DWB77_07257 [Streptomyces hundungensis]